VFVLDDEGYEPDLNREYWGVRNFVTQLKK
jgi:hypothetical protein